MKKYKSSFPISFLVRQLSVSVSGFYDWLRNGLSRRAIQFNQKSILVKLVQLETQEIYGQFTWRYFTDFLRSHLVFTDTKNPAGVGLFSLNLGSEQIAQDIVQDTTGLKVFHLIQGINAAQHSKMATRTIAILHINLQHLMRMNIIRQA